MEQYWDDCQAWLECNIEDKWIYDKLILSSKLGYTCGPVGLPVPKPDNYIVRPITNMMGMGIKAKIHYIEEDTEHFHPGLFWCEIFYGTYYSIDYINGKQILCVKGYKNSDTLYKWNRWVVSNYNIVFPLILEPIKEKYPYINCEFIDGKLIEVHLRHNPDFKHNYKELIPVWENEEINPPNDMIFIKSKDYKRQGFYAK